MKQSLKNISVNLLTFLNSVYAYTCLCFTYLNVPFIVLCLESGNDGQTQAFYVLPFSPTETISTYILVEEEEPEPGTFNTLLYKEQTLVTKLVFMFYSTWPILQSLLQSNLNLQNLSKNSQKVQSRVRHYIAKHHLLAKYYTN